MPWGPQFFSPCLQICKSSPNWRKPSFLWTAACTATWLNPSKGRLWQQHWCGPALKPGQSPAVGSWGRGCQLQTWCTGVVLHLKCWQRTKEILIPYKFCSGQARHSLHFAIKPPQPSDLILFPKKDIFVCWRWRGTNTPAHIPSGGWCCGQPWCSCGNGVFFHFIQASNANTCFVCHVKICWAKIYSCTLTLVDCILCKYLTCLLLPCSL